MSEICLGCGNECRTQVDCAECYRRLERCLNVFGHWPLELALSPAALLQIETAIRSILPKVDDSVQGELSNAVSIIRAYLQRVAAGELHFERELTDEELLS